MSCSAFFLCTPAIHPVKVLKIQVLKLQNGGTKQIYLFPRHANVLNPPTTCYLTAQIQSFLKRFQTTYFRKRITDLFTIILKKLLQELLQELFYPVALPQG